MQQIGKQQCPALLNMGGRWGEVLKRNGIKRELPPDKTPKEQRNHIAHIGQTLPYLDKGKIFWGVSGDKCHNLTLESLE